MPRAKIERVVSDDGVTQTVEIEFKERDETKTTQYQRPSSDAKWQETVLTLTGGALTDAYRRWCVMLDREARAAAYESLAQESTMVTVGKEKVDIMEFPLARLVKGINGFRSQREVRLETAGVVDPDAPEAEDLVKAIDRGLGFGPWRVAARKLVEMGKAKENAASGMLEAIA